MSGDSIAQWVAFKTSLQRRLGIDPIASDLFGGRGQVVPFTPIIDAARTAVAYRSAVTDAVNDARGRTSLLQRVFVSEAGDLSQQLVTQLEKLVASLDPSPLRTHVTGPLILPALRCSTFWEATKGLALLAGQTIPGVGVTAIGPIVAAGEGAREAIKDVAGDLGELVGEVANTAGQAAGRAAGGFLKGSGLDVILLGGAGLFAADTVGVI